jgi:hypothetical protein
MTIPGFTAEASLFKASRQYHVTRLRVWSDRVAAAFPWDPPQLTVSYRPGFPGTLTVSGQNFTPDVDVLLTISNCEVNPYQFTVHTTKRFSYCPHPWNCRYYYGGDFTTAVGCYCGGTATVEAIDGQSGNTASAAAGLPC